MELGFLSWFLSTERSRRRHQTNLAVAKKSFHPAPPAADTERNEVVSSNQTPGRGGQHVFFWPAWRSAFRLRLEFF
jgi:hypothetical protein